MVLLNKIDRIRRKNHNSFHIIIIIRFRQCQGNYKSSVAYRDNYPFINMISFIIDKNNK